MEPILKDLSDSSLLTAIEENLFAMIPLFEEWSKAEVRDSPELLELITEIPFPLFNSVLRPRLSPETMDDAINATITRCKLKNVPMLWWIGPSSQPSDLGSRLESFGFQATEVPGMAADLDSLPEKLELPRDFVVDKVKSNEDLEIWCRVLCKAFEMPDFVGDAFFEFYRNIGFDQHSPNHNYLGSLKDEVVATSSLFLGAGVAGIYNVATLQDSRRKGIGAAMTAAPLMEARSLGYRVGILHSSDIGFNVYRKLGFQEYCKIYQHVWSGN
jgi:GNAT superfamily N-acetyltransferase